jgi:hypothetical protein
MNTLRIKKSIIWVLFAIFCVTPLLSAAPVIAADAITASWAQQPATYSEDSISVGGIIFKYNSCNTTNEQDNCKKLISVMGLANNIPFRLYTASKELDKVDPKKAPTDTRAQQPTGIIIQTDTFPATHKASIVQYDFSDNPLVSSGLGYKYEGILAFTNWGGSLYFQGKTVFEGLPWGGYSIIIKQIDANGKSIRQLGVQADNETSWVKAQAYNTSQISGSNNADEVAAKDGTFRSEPGLPPGIYTIEVNETAKSYWERVGSNLQKFGCAVLNTYAGLGGMCQAMAIYKGLTGTDGEFKYMASTGPITVVEGKQPDYVTLNVEKVVVSPLGEALSGAINTLGQWIQFSLKFTMDQIGSLLGKTPDYVIGPIGCKATAVAPCGMLGPWTAMRNIGLTLLVVALILIAFANVLQIDIEQYGLNRMIPKIIISILLAFGSWIIVTFFFDFTKAIQDQALSLLGTSSGGGYGGLNFMQSLTISTPGAGNILSNTGSVLLMLVIAVGVLVCGVILMFTLVLRIVMLAFLLAVAPIAFILNIVPFTSSMYKQWWNEFFKWMFMGPIALVIIALGAVMASAATQGAFGSKMNIDAATAATDGGGQLLIGLIIFAAAMYVGATLPMSWGGGIMKSFSGIGKKAWGATGGAAIKHGWEKTGVPGAWNTGRAEMKRRGDAANKKTSAQILKRLPGSLGEDPALIEARERTAKVDEFKKLHEAKQSTVGDLQAVTHDKNKRPEERMAAYKLLADKDKIEYEPDKLGDLYDTFGAAEADSLLFGNRKKNPHQAGAVEAARQAHATKTGKTPPEQLFDSAKIARGLNEGDIKDISGDALRDQNVLGGLNLTPRGASSLSTNQLDSLLSNAGRKAAPGAAQAFKQSLPQVAPGQLSPQDIQNYRNASVAANASLHHLDDKGIQSLHDNGYI